MKTLAQIAYKAAMDIPDFDDRWESAAQAVRAAVIEECALIAEDYGPYTWASENSDRYHAQAEWGRTIAAKLRAMKDKK